MSFHKRLQALGLRYRLRLAYSVFLIAILTLFYQMYLSGREQVDIARLERTGVDYIAGLRGFGVEFGAGSRPGGLAAAIDRVEAAADGALGTAELAGKLKAAAGRDDPAVLQQALAGLIDLVADNSTLSLDPEVASYYLQKVVTEHLARGALHLGRLRVLALEKRAAGDATAASVAQARVQTVFDQLSSELDAMAKSFAKIVAADPDAAPALDVPARDIAATMLARAGALLTAAPDADLAIPARDALAAGNRLSGLVETEMNRQLELRIARTWRDLAVNGAVSGAIFLLGLALMIIGVERGAIRPLERLTQAIVKLAEGDQAVTVDGLARGGEIGDIARAVDIFRQNAIEKERLTEAHAAARIAEIERAGRIAALTAEFDGQAHLQIEALSRAATDLDQIARAVAVATSRTQSESTAIVDAAHSMTDNVQTVAASTEELGASIREIVIQVSSSRRIADRATRDGLRAADTIAGLAESIERVGSVTQLITGIAAQTNLLALNATIEAARAGDAGKGFAVVASEVKNLANQTAQATEDIARQLADIQRGTGEAVSAMSAVSDTIRELDAISGTIAVAIQQQGAATQEIARSITEAANGTEAVSQRIGQVSRIASESERLSGTLQTSSVDLLGRTTALDGSVARFLASVRGS